MTRATWRARATAVSATIVLVLSGCTSTDDEPEAAATQDAAPSEEPVDEAGGANSDLPMTEPGTYTYDNGPFPVTFTTTVPTIDPSRGNDTYRVLLGDPYGGLGFDFPVNVADLSQPVTAADDAESVTAGSVDLLYAGPIDFPADVGAWLEGAASLQIVDEATLTLADGEASWWDVEVTEASAVCFADTPPDEDPCVILWPYLAEQEDVRSATWFWSRRVCTPSSSVASR